MRFAAITDEISPDLERALAVARELGIGEVELNGLWGREFAELSEDDVDRVERLLKDARMPVCAVDTMAFKKLALEAVAAPRAHTDWPVHLSWLKRGCERARRFGAPFVRVFSFYKTGMAGNGNPSPRLPGGGPIPEATLGKIASGLREAGDIAEAHGVDLIVENVRSCWGNSCVNLAQILRAAKHPRLKCVWDPGNDFVAGGDPFPAGYEAQKPWMVHVHLKNAEVADAASGLTRWQRIGGGAIDYRPLLKRLFADGYPGALTLETHWRGEGLDAEESSRRSFADLKAVLAEIGR
ncbi:MAG: sugar phosphate isomerase/epimerase [Planctomycetes bacterium]|nr:sugar phosphate isomerase/epimerase [Planctomycetota bacterium]